MQIVTTRYGELPVTESLERYPDGALMSCAPAGPALFQTPLGVLAPQHSTDDVRRRTVQAVHFFADGSLRHLPLEERTEVPTPAGRLPAELVTFHPNGAVSRVFPLNGKLSGYWTQEDEGRLASPVTLATPLGPVTARIIGVAFTPGGALRSITFWPGETLELPTPAGVLSVRNGVSFRPDGSVRSVEPARPQVVATPAGPVQAYDLDACGICGDENSLEFAPEGAVARVATNLTRLVVTGPDGAAQSIEPATRESLCGDTEQEPVPLRLCFAPGLVTAQVTPEAAPRAFPTPPFSVRTAPHVAQFANPLGLMRCSV